MYADTKPFVYNYEKHVVLLMILEHSANKLCKKTHTHTYIDNSHYVVKYELEHVVLLCDGACCE